jgi:hypothetical protein
VSHGNSEVSWKIRLRSGDGPATRSPNDQTSPPRFPFQAGDQIEQSALAAAGGTQQHDELAGRDVEVHVAQCEMRPLGAFRPHLADVAADHGVLR